MSLRSHLESLDAGSLAALLRRRGDVLVEPAPRTLRELAERLGGAASLSSAMVAMDRDEVAVVRALALVGAAPVARVAGLLRSEPAAVQDVVDRLGARGLAWEVDGGVELPDRLATDFAAEVIGFRPLSAIVKTARFEDLCIAITGLGGVPNGRKRADLVHQLAALLADPGVVVRAVQGLPAPAVRHLESLLRNEVYYGFGGTTGPVTALVEAGLLVPGQYSRSELPREVVVALMVGQLVPLSGRPDVPASAAAVVDGRAAADAAVLALTALLDEAADSPLAALKKGGIGAREQKRLATRLGVGDVALWIDLAYASGLLVVAPEGFVPAADYERWRDEPVAARWASVVLAWFGLDLAPTSRETDDGDVAPPIPMESMAGVIRRAFLRSAAGGGSLHAAAGHIDWFSPLHRYDEGELARKLFAAEHEATLLGLRSDDRLTALGEHLVELSEHPDAATELAARATELLPETRGMLVLQSDLTALVSGQASTAATRVLAASAVPESKGVAATWRFTPASVRAALDGGWAVDELRTELAKVSGRELPQPLDYLLTDVARRHGSIRVRGSLSCVSGAEAEITEILHTRSLAKLRLTRLAPTVLTSPLALDEVLAKLRSAGFLPVPEDAAGVVVVPERAKVTATDGRARRARRQLDAADLARRLTGATRVVPKPSETHERLVTLRTGLSGAEIALLADALDNGRDVRIEYHDSVRDIAPKDLWHHSLLAWCYLRSDEREFIVDEIAWVGPTTKR